MEIEVSDCNGNIRVSKEGVVEEYKKLSDLEYSVTWGNEELIFSPESREELENLGTWAFGLKLKGLETSPKVTFIYKMNGHELLKGIYFISEPSSGEGKKFLEIHADAAGVNNQFRIFLTPEPHETLESIFKKIFHLEKSI